MSLLTFNFRCPWDGGAIPGKCSFHGDGDANEGKSWKSKRRDEERDVTREPFVSLAPANSELAAACRRLLCRSHEEDARLLLCSPFVSYWEGHTVVCSPLHRLVLSLHEWKDVGILTVKVWLLTTRGGSRTAMESSGTVRCIRGLRAFTSFLGLFYQRPISLTTIPPLIVRRKIDKLEKVKYFLCEICCVNADEYAR